MRNLTCGQPQWLLGNGNNERRLTRINQSDESDIHRRRGTMFINEAITVTFPPAKVQNIRSKVLTPVKTEHPGQTVDALKG